MTGDIYDGKPVTRNADGIPTVTPAPKVVAATTGAVIGGAVTTLGLWVLQQTTGIVPPIEVDGAILTLVTAAVAFLSGYVKRP